jgi:hypothetical protein
MPFVVKDDVVPEDMVMKNNRLYKIVMAAIIVIYLLYGIFGSLKEMCNYFECEQSQELVFPYLLIMFIDFALAILVGVYLFIAVFKIRSFLLK